MKLKVNSNFVYRVLRFSVQDNIEESWEELKICIEHSSDVFYQTIKNAEANELAVFPHLFNLRFGNISTGQNSGLRHTAILLVLA